MGGCFRSRRLLFWVYGSLSNCVHHLKWLARFHCIFTPRGSLSPAVHSFILARSLGMHVRCTWLARSPCMFSDYGSLSSNVILVSWLALICCIFHHHGSLPIGAYSFGMARSLPMLFSSVGSLRFPDNSRRMARSCNLHVRELWLALWFCMFFPSGSL